MIFFNKMNNGLIITNAIGEIVYKNAFANTSKTKIPVNLSKGVYLISNITPFDTDQIRFIIK